MTEVDDNQLLLTVGEAARLLRLSRTFTYELAARGELPVIRFGRRVLIQRDALERYLRENAEVPATAVRPVIWNRSMRHEPKRDGAQLPAGHHDDAADVG